MAGITAAEREERDRLYEHGLKNCNTCRNPLPLGAFKRRADGYRGLDGSCRECCNRKTSDWQKRNAEKCAAKCRAWNAANRSRSHEIAKRYRDSYKRPCSIAGCDKSALTHSGVPLCGLHQRRVRVHGDPYTVLPPLAGENSPRWVGDAAGYKAAHHRVRASRGKASEYRCAAGCGSQAEHRSYRGGAPDERTESVIMGGSFGGREVDAPFSLNVSFYDALCRSCHIKRDVWKKDVLSA